MSRKPKNNRNADLAKIHILAEQAGMDTKDKDPDSTYRRMLWTLGRVRSASKLDQHGRQKVIQHLTPKRGNKYQKRHELGKPPANINSEQFGPMLRKIQALLIDSKKTWAYADGISKTMFGIDKIQFCGAQHLRAVISALTKDQQRRVTK